ncbi:hypothetical protein [Rubrivirga marina]|uniref:TonB C-terminal domain-containing protein n=1 Tax=Rubrivirga marina TaxID=1196024 RepID=A0A271IZV0_9BACT|nr:hypothetical protein [Rubrivirga marina]PAP76518.1 hypothetical protein BSZ37_08725 [Rubrivirga marina]
MRPLLCLLALATLAACSEPGPPATPPEGWVEASPARWYVPGTDTTAAFRDLTTLEAMGVARDESEFVRWVQEKMTDIYRTDPETVDSVFAAEFLDDVQAGVPEGDDYGAAADALVNQIKTDFFQRYNASRYQPQAEGLVVPDSLSDASGRVAVQVYVDEANEPVAIKLVEGTGTALDQIFMRRVLGSTFTDAWVRPEAGRVGGVEIPNWVHVESDFGG